MGNDFFSADHVVFGTDAPLGPIAKTVDALCAVGLDRESELKILSGNAAGLLRFRSRNRSMPTNHRTAVPDMKCVPAAFAEMHERGHHKVLTYAAGP
jgi:hypothetical protein